MTVRAVSKIANDFAENKAESFAITRENPFVYLRLLAEDYNIKASAVAVLREKKLVGYNFKAAS